jgi:hypothetical protein
VRSYLAVAGALLACSSEEGGEPGFVPERLELTTGVWQVPSNDEVTRCMYVDLPVDRDFYGVGYRATMLPGSHHFNMFYADPSLDATGSAPKNVLTDCNGELKFYLAGSQWDSVESEFPPGVAVKIPRGSVLVLETHYVNLTDAPIEGRLDVAFEEGDPATIDKELGLYFNVMTDIRVEPLQRARLSASCAADEGSNVVILTSHMHHHGSTFEINLVDDATGQSEPLYLSEDYSHPTIDERWDAPIVIPAGNSLEWACTYQNPYDAMPLVDGDSAVTDEMCIMAAFYWPKVRELPYCLATATAEPL